MNAIFKHFSLRLEKQQWKNMIRRITLCLHELQISQQLLIWRRRYCVVNTSETWKQHNQYFQSSSINLSLDLMSRRKDLPDDLACFLQQQKQRQARLETTMRSFPSRGDMDLEKLEAKKKKNIHEVSSTWWEGRRIIFNKSGRTIAAIWSYRSLGLGCVTPAIVPFTWYTCSLPVRFLYHQTIRNSTYNFDISKQYNRNDLNI